MCTTNVRTFLPLLLNSKQDSNVILQNIFVKQPTTLTFNVEVWGRAYQRCYCLSPQTHKAYTTLIEHIQSTQSTKSLLTENTEHTEHTQRTLKLWHVVFDEVCTKTTSLHIRKCFLKFTFVFSAGTNDDLFNCTQLWRAIHSYTYSSVLNRFILHTSHQAY